MIACAEAAIAQYVIINLRNRTAEVFTEPHTSNGTYGEAKIVPAIGPLQLRVAENEYVSVVMSELLP